MEAAEEPSQASSRSLGGKKEGTDVEKLPARQVEANGCDETRADATAIKILYDGERS